GRGRSAAASHKNGPIVVNVAVNLRHEESWYFILEAPTILGLVSFEHDLVAGAVADEAVIHSQARKVIDADGSRGEEGDDGAVAEHCRLLKLGEVVSRFSLRHERKAEIEQRSGFRMLLLRQPSRRGQRLVLQLSDELIEPAPFLGGRHHAQRIVKLLDSADGGLGAVANSEQMIDVVRHRPVGDPIAGNRLGAEIALPVAPGEKTPVSMLGLGNRPRRPARCWSPGMQSITRLARPVPRITMKLWPFRDRARAAGGIAALVAATFASGRRAHRPFLGLGFPSRCPRNSRMYSS